MHRAKMLHMLEMAYEEIEHLCILLGRYPETALQVQEELSYVIDDLLKEGEK